MSKSSIKVDRIQVEGNRISVTYSTAGIIGKYLNGEPFIVEYQEDVSRVPEYVAIIPFLANTLPIVWCCDASVVVEEVDESFYKSINDIKVGYERMYPSLTLGGTIGVKRLCQSPPRTLHRAAMFFSGGVDSTSTLLSRLTVGDRPDLITIWGSDIPLDHSSGWKRVKDSVSRVGSEFGLKNVFIKSNFRTFLDEKALDSLVSPTIKDSWWHGIQHGMGIIGHVAPYAFLHQIGTVYMPGTYSEQEVVNSALTCASDPSIDESVRFLDAKIVHEGFLQTRQDKIRGICDYYSKTGKPLSLRVCFESTAGYNCGTCEKCGRTIMAIMSEGGNPNDFGFSVNKNAVTEIRKRLETRWIIGHSLTHWKAIKRTLSMKESVLTADVSWVMDVDFDQINASKRKKLQMLLNSISRKLKELLPRGVRKTLKSFKRRFF